jgi:hypothetical protein
MKTLAQTEYQDLYRVTDGVLLVVNKFASIDYSKKTTRVTTVYSRDAKTKSYYKGCQKDLKILKQDYFDEYGSITIPKGTVLYFDRPVIATSDQSDWKYEVKTTGSALGGSKDEIEKLLMSILYTIRNNNVR